MPVEGGTGRAVVSPAASTLRQEMAVSGQRLPAASGQIPMAAHRQRWCRGPHLLFVNLDDINLEFSPVDFKSRPTARSSPLELPPAHVPKIPVEIGSVRVDTTL